MTATKRSLPPSSRSQQQQKPNVGDTPSLYYEYHAKQIPRICVEPAGQATTEGSNAAALCEHYWFKLDEWQEAILNCWLGRDADGRLLVISAGLSVPRQNGKNASIEAMELYLLVTRPGYKILHTAHSTKTAQKAFFRMEAVFTGKVAGKKRESRTLQKMVDKKNGGSIRYTNGEWAIYLNNGASIEYATRTNSGGRGFDGINLLIYDEAQELTDEHVEALGPVTDAAVGDSVIIYAGTPPNETASGTVFRRHRSAALKDPGPHESWHEWSIDTLPDEHATFDELLPLVYDTNPSMELPRPGHLTIDRTRRNFADMSFIGFCRERLGYWEESEVLDPAIDYKLWAKLENKHPTNAKNLKRTIGVKFSPDGDYVAVVNVSKYGRGKPHVELMEYANISRAGVQPLVNALYRLRNKVAYIMIDGLSNADTLVDGLKKKKYPSGGYGLAKTRDVIAAATNLKDGVRSGAFTHFGQGALDESVRTSTRRKVGNYGGFGFGGVSPEPLEAASLGLLAMKRTRRNPKKKTVIYY